MTDSSDQFPITLGVEEELFLVDPQSGDLLVDPDVGIFEACGNTYGPHKVVREFFRCQIETNTRVCHSVAEVRTALQETRGIVADAAARHGASVMASSTHPFAAWQVQRITPSERYQRFLASFQDAVRHFVINGMHVHAGFGDPETRILVMTALRRYLPLLHALSSSSPFSSGRETGFKSYRLNLLSALPRTGIPGPLYSQADYDRLMTEYRRIGFLRDGSELWWDIRPSHFFPTIELRICDVCTRIEDGVAIVALYACLIRWLLRQAHMGTLPTEPLTELIEEERWITQRHGVFPLFDHRSGDGGRMGRPHTLEELREHLAEDAQVLDCEAELDHALVTIARDGTCADRQLDRYHRSRQEGDGHQEALRHVVDLVLTHTKEHHARGTTLGKNPNQTA
ncbi:carboxylate-amine ligase [Candidatus Synechococcus spongiarum]|uniref:Putative glutamate--cysteine ligase 2 n=1 Tax=Candidatus Synechococcus spongiarum TaxID=431041 RepID=A0A170T7G7_9SYNE|nr:carboxylate-amine ligase [Candidatus Synechococcus spongiarum]CZB15890.1 Carboxylate-amine ligase bll3764 [Candidatus Synechococcus spongiarum]